MHITIKEVIAATNSKVFNKHFSNLILNSGITNVVIDSRKATDKSLFIPFAGENSNGYAFVEVAFKNGAVAVLWEKRNPNPPFHLGPIILVEDCLVSLQALAKYHLNNLNCKTVGITGSNGKTSTKDVLFALCERSYKTFKTQGNYNNHLGLPLTILSAPSDTEVLILEMGMSGFGEIDLLASIATPDIAIITNIGESHIEHLGSREGIAKAKYEITNYFDSKNVLIFDGDEPLLTNMFFQDDIKGISYGFEPLNDVFVKTEKQSLTPEFTLSGKLNLKVKSNLLGSHQAKNCTAAIIAASKLGVPNEAIITALQEVQLTPMRMQLIEFPSTAIINDCYNASPTSMKAAIDFLGEYPTNKPKTLVIGDMLELGDDSIQYHIDLFDTLKDHNFEQIIFVGKLSAHPFNIFKAYNTVDAIRTEVFHYEHCAHLLTDMKNFDFDQHIILLKGSRGMKLESLLSHFQ